MGGTLAMGVNNITGTGAISATTFNGALNGNANTASALFADPGDCALPNVALGVNAAGVAQCSQPSNVSGSAATVTGAAQTAITSVGTLTGLTVTATISGSINGNANTATALAANGTNCAAGSFAVGVNASGVAECSVLIDTPSAGKAVCWKTATTLGYCTDPFVGGVCTCN